MKWWAVVLILLLILIGISTQTYFIFKERNSLKAQISDLNGKLQSLQSENQDLTSEVKYYSNPENLIKELKSKFNYKKPDENMMIIVPQQ